MASVNPEAPLEGQGRIQVSVYSRFRPLQKRTITAIAAFCGFLAQASTTSVLAAVPEIVETYHTTANVISISNAVYLAFMGLSSLIWGPWADIFGRRSVCSKVHDQVPYIRTLLIES